MATLSPYKIHWVILIPTRLNATKGDAQALGCDRENKELLFKHFPTAEKANEWIDDRRTGFTITKPYKAYIMSDKQFSMLPEFTRAGVMQVLTQSQIKKSITIKFR